MRQCVDCLEETIEQKDEVIATKNAEIAKMRQRISKLEGGQKQDQVRDEQSSNMVIKRECKKGKYAASDSRSKRTAIERGTTLEELFGVSLLQIMFMQMSSDTVKRQMCPFEMEIEHNRENCREATVHFK